MSADARWTLRAAMQEANALPGTDSIIFQIASGTQTVSPTTALPDITEAVTIDGTTQPGVAGSRIVELAGSQTNGVSPLTVRAGSRTIRGLVVNRFRPNPTVGGPQGIVTLAVGAGGGANVVEGNFVGTDVTRTQVFFPVGTGVYLETSNNRIGGTAPGAANLVAGLTGQAGIRIGQQQLLGLASNYDVQGNLMETQRIGTVALSNHVGIRIASVTGPAVPIGTAIGGTAADARNVISGNAVGVTASGRNTVVQGNFIGTDLSNTRPICNIGDGIVFGTAPALRPSIFVLGGSGAGKANVIRFNGGVRVRSTFVRLATNLSNGISDNGGLGIDLPRNGVTPNDPCKGVSRSVPPRRRIPRTSRCSGRSRWSEAARW